MLLLGDVNADKELKIVLSTVMWIRTGRIRIILVFRIRIRVNDADLDPGSKKKSVKIMENSHRNL